MIGSRGQAAFGPAPQRIADDCVEAAPRAPGAAVQAPAGWHVDTALLRPTGLAASASQSAGSSSTASWKAALGRLASSPPGITRPRMSLSHPCSAPSSSPYPVGPGQPSIPGMYAGIVPIPDPPRPAGRHVDRSLPLRPARAACRYRPGLPVRCRSRSAPPWYRKRPVQNPGKMPTGPCLRSGRKASRHTRIPVKASGVTIETKQNAPVHDGSGVK